jgi:archaeoflavoprotein AfpA
MTLNIAWGITGSGDLLEETIEVMEDLSDRYDLKIRVFLSKEGELVLRYYKLLDSLKMNFSRVNVEKGANTPFIAGELQLGIFDLLLVSPATGNTTAKIAHGIADSLMTNAVSQAMKARVPVYILPVDQKMGETKTKLPDGGELRLTMREVDVENVEKLRKMRGITVLSNPKEIEDAIREYLGS